MLCLAALKVSDRHFCKYFATLLQRYEPHGESHANCREALRNLETMKAQLGEPFPWIAMLLFCCFFVLLQQKLALKWAKPSTQAPKPALKITTCSKHLCLTAQSGTLKRGSWRAALQIIWMRNRASSFSDPELKLLINIRSGEFGEGRV